MRRSLLLLCLAAALVAASGRAPAGAGGDRGSAEVSTAELMGLDEAAGAAVAQEEAESMRFSAAAVHKAGGAASAAKSGGGASKSGSSKSGAKGGDKGGASAPPVGANDCCQLCERQFFADLSFLQLPLHQEVRTAAAFKHRHWRATPHAYVSAAGHALGLQPHTGYRVLPTVC